MAGKSDEAADSTTISLAWWSLRVISFCAECGRKPRDNESAAAERVTAPGSWSHATFAWNHGGYTDDIVRIWAGFVGPGIRSGGDDDTWVDHTDLRPTILTLTGLADDYPLDGALVGPIVDTKALPQTLRAHRATLDRLTASYKQINAPVGRFGLDVIEISDAAVRSSDESRYEELESAIQSLAAEREGLAAEMRSLLEQATFGGHAIDEQHAKDLIARAEALLARADSTASSA